MMDEKHNRVMILGLDGATLDLIRPWAEAGILPTFQKLMREGAWGLLRSTMPPVTPAAWSSFITGMNPGKHGVFDFTARKQESYDTYIVESNVRQAPSLWQLASRAGKRVIVYNVPMTYPPERVNGLMVSGLLTPDTAKDASYPPELQKELEELIPGLVLSGHPLFHHGGEKEFMRDLLETHDQNFRAARYLMDRQPWDLFVVVFQHTDTMGHFMWKHMENGGAGLPESDRVIAANAIRDCYRDVDAKLGQLIEAAGEDTHVIIMSDHGLGSLSWYFAVNTWLLQKGYIKLKRDTFTRLKYLIYRLGLTPELAFRVMLKLGLAGRIQPTGDAREKPTRQRLKRFFLSFEDIDWSRTRAYSRGYCGPVFLNVKGRELQGMVEPGKEYDELLNEIISDLATVKEPSTDSPLFPEIHRGHDIYSGPFADRGPDLLFFPRDWKYSAYGRREFLEKNSLTPMRDNGSKINSLMQMLEPYSGTHRMDGILFFSGPGVRENFEIADASLLDIAPTALALLGVPVPEDMDGQVLKSALRPELQEQLDITYAGADGSKPELQPVADMSPEDEVILLARLRNLGYVD